MDRQRPFLLKFEFIFMRDTTSSEETTVSFRMCTNTTTSQILAAVKETEGHTSVYPPTPILGWFPWVWNAFALVPVAVSNSDTGATTQQMGFASAMLISSHSVSAWSLWSRNYPYLLSEPRWFCILNPVRKQSDWERTHSQRSPDCWRTHILWEWSMAEDLSRHVYTPNSRRPLVVGNHQLSVTRETSASPFTMLSDAPASRLFLHLLSCMLTPSYCIGKSGTSWLRTCPRSRATPTSPEDHTGNLD